MWNGSVIRIQINNEFFETEVVLLTANVKVNG